MPVRGEGRKNAKLVVIGEALGKEEAEKGRPFVGPSGMVLERWWRQVGLARGDFYIDNVVQVRPPNNDLTKLPKAEIEQWVDDLHRRLAELEDPWLIVPTGATALQAITGKKSIGKMRGSILEYTDRIGRKIKVIPTLHPAATFRQPYWEKRCVRDWERIKGDSEFRELRLPRREHYIKPSLQAVEELVKHASQHAGMLSLDIETPGGVVACVGVSYDPGWSWTIPTVPAYWGDNQTTSYVWSLVKAICMLPCPKVLQNGFFDAYWLWRKHRIKIVNYCWDTLALHHCLDPAEDHDLAFMASVDSREPYWKDEAKDPEEVQRYASNIEALWTYNGKDVCVQRELGETYFNRISSRGLHAFYQQHYRDLFDPLLSLMLHGVRVDEQRRRRRLGKALAERIGIEDRLQALAGRPLHAAVGISPQKLLAWMREQRIKPAKAKTADHRWIESTNEVALRKVMQKQAKFRPVGELVLQHREVKKLSEFLAEGIVDSDGRMRSSYSFSTDTGRLNSRKNPMGTGANAQNQDRRVRDVFVADEGCVFVEVDLSQAESRIVDILTDDPVLWERARSLPAERDVHRENASRIFGCTMAEITKEQRYLGKRAKHAGNYGMQGETLADQLIKEGYSFSAAKCQELIERAVEPAILRWQMEVRATILRERRLVNSWGQELDFSYERLSDETYRRGYAFVPQSECVKLLNLCGFVPLHEWLRDRQLRSKVNQNGHDSLLLSCPPTEVYPVMAFLSEKLSAPRAYRGRWLAIPVEFKLGSRWGEGMTEWKALPAEGEVEEALAEFAA